MKPIIAFLKKKDLYLGITRYLLGLVMVTYALTKILRTQFVVIPFSLWQRPLETLSGRTIAWAFLGYSPWFQILLGFLELIPSILLLFRRTTLAGAILLLPMTLNVFLINHALNLWDDTKTISLILLILNIIVLLFEWKKIKGLVMIVVNKGRRYKFSAWEIGINLIAVVALSYFYLPWLLEYKNDTNALTGDWYNQHPNEWVLKSEKIGDSTLAPRLMKSYYGAFGEYSEINDTGYVKRGMMSYAIDEKKHMLKFYNADNKLLYRCSFSVTGDTTLTLIKTIDSVKNTKVSQVFKRRTIKIGADK